VAEETIGKAREHIEADLYVERHGLRAKITPLRKAMKAGA
jgi:hypothetical protein